VMDRVIYWISPYAPGFQSILLTAYSSSAANLAVDHPAGGQSRSSEYHKFIMDKAMVERNWRFWSHIGNCGRIFTWCFKFRNAGNMHTKCPCTNNSGSTIKDLTFAWEL
jgi:hypothetical protein